MNDPTITIFHNPTCGTDDQLIDFMIAHPILMNRPIVVTPLGARLCRPSGGRAHQGG